LRDKEETAVKHIHPHLIETELESIVKYSKLKTLLEVANIKY